MLDGDRSPSDADCSDPTGGVNGPLDDEDYCGWLCGGLADDF